MPEDADPSIDWDFIHSIATKGLSLLAEFDGQMNPLLKAFIKAFDDINTRTGQVTWVANRANEVARARDSGGDLPPPESLSAATNYFAVHDLQRMTARLRRLPLPPVPRDPFALESARGLPPRERRRLLRIGHWQAYLLGKGVLALQKPQQRLRSIVASCQRSRRALYAVQQALERVLAGPAAGHYLLWHQLSLDWHDVGIVIPENISAVVSAAEDKDREATQLQRDWRAAFDRWSRALIDQLSAEAEALRSEAERFENLRENLIQERDQLLEERNQLEALELRRQAAARRAQHWAGEVLQLQNRIATLRSRFSELHSRIQQLRVDVRKVFDDPGHPYPCPNGAPRYGPPERRCTHHDLIANFDRWLEERKQELREKEAERDRVSNNLAAAESNLTGARSERDSATAERDDLAQELEPRRIAYNRAYPEWWRSWTELISDPAFAETTAFAAQNQIDFDLMRQRLNLLQP